MEKVLEFLRRDRWWPAWILIGGALLLLPRLGQPGFWEPYEIKVADEARTRLERHSLADITRTVAGVYKVRESHMKKAERNDKQTEARNVALYLADIHTKESYSDLRQAFSVDKHEVVESVIKGMRERLGNEAEAELRKQVDEINQRLDKLAANKSQTGPPLTEWAVARGLDGISWNEWGARLPLALLGLLGLMATFFLGRRLGGPRAGLLSAIALMAMPLFVLQSRQLTSDIGAITGSAAMMLGLVGLSWPAQRGGLPSWQVAARYAGDIALVIVGAVITYYAAGALLGLVPPLAAIALANPIAAIADRRNNEPADGHPDAVADGDRRWRLLHLLAAGLVAGVVACIVLVWIIGAAFDFTDPMPGGRQILGKSWVPSPDYVEALGGVWKAEGDVRITFNSLFEQIAFGAFPWSALAPLAIAQIAMGVRRGRRNWAGYALFIWAAVAWALATIMLRKVGPVHYPAIAAIAVAVGLWLDDLWSSRAICGERGADAARARTGLPPTLPLAGLFVAAACVVLAKDIKTFPENLTSLHLLSGTVDYPKDLSLTTVYLGLAMLFAVASFAGLWLWGMREPADRSPLRERLRATRGVGPVARLILHATIELGQRALRLGGRYGVHAMLILGVVFGLFLAQVWTPALSKKLSSKHLFARYHELKSSGDRLGVMGNHGNGPKYYAGDSFTRLRNRTDLLAFLEDERRSFALVPASELCPVHRAAAKSELEYHVLDDSHAKFLLMSNLLESGERDLNPLSRSILREQPAKIGRPVQANFNNTVELLGVDMPSSVGRGDSFELVLYFKVLKSVSGNWKIFAHFDTGGMRFQGDHDPINGRCGTAFWQAGDYIVDRYWVEAGDISYPKGNYVARIGFFQGSHGSWKNMKVVKGNADDNDRVLVGNIQVR